MRVVLLLLVAGTLSGQLFAQKINIGKETTIRRNLTDEEKVKDRKIKVGQLLEMLDWNNRSLKIQSFISLSCKIRK